MARSPLYGDKKCGFLRVQFGHNRPRCRSPADLRTRRSCAAPSGILGAGTAPEPPADLPGQAAPRARSRPAPGSKGQGRARTRPQLSGSPGRSDGPRRAAGRSPRISGRAAAAQLPPGSWAPARRRSLLQIFPARLRPGRAAVPLRARKDRAGHGPGRSSPALLGALTAPGGPLVNLRGSPDVLQLCSSLRILGAGTVTRHGQPV